MERIDPRVFGAQGDGLTDDAPAINAALALGSDGQRGYEVVLSKGIYRCASDLRVQKNCRFTGVSGARNGQSRIQFTDGCKLHIDAGGQSAIISNLQINSLGAGLPLSSRISNIPGIYCEAKAYFEHVGVFGFSGHGLHIDGSTAQRNANGWRASNCWFENNEGWGVYVGGLNSNAGVADGIFLISNGLGGLRESSFLGNTYLGLTIEGLLYPVSPEHPRPQGMWVDGNVNKCTILGSYIESDHAPSLFDSTSTVVIGGTFGQSVNPASTAAIFLGFDSNFPFGVRKGTARIGLGQGGGMLYVQDDREDSDLHLSFGANREGWWEWIRSGISALAISSNLTPQGPGKLLFPDGYYIAGPGQAMRKVAISDTAPNGGGTVGDRVYHVDPTPGGHVGWIYTSSAGWKKFGVIEA